MKKMNLLVMSLVSAAALSFTSCSDSEDLANDKAGQEKVDGFYMTLSIQTPKANGTRTSQTDRTTEKATDDEAKVTTGTFYLYDGDKCIFKKQITEADWKQKTSDKQNTGITNAIKVSVNGVAENHPYHVYFLAGNKTSDTPTTAEFTGEYTIDQNNPTSISLDLAEAGSFVMFNQNDAQHHLGGNAATVTFTSENKTATNPAKCENIYLDRAAARIDAPNAANATKITTGEGDNAPATKNLDLVANIAYQNYAVSNLNTKTNVMQKWDSEYKTFSAPAGTYVLDYNTYGDKYNNNGSLVNFGSATSTYILENSTANLKNATALYLCYKANLTTTSDKDFEDGTFYRYDGKIYTSLKQIYEDPTVEYPFVNANTGVKVEPAEAVNIIKDENGKLRDENTLAAFRQKYNIDVYEQGLMYYRVALDDQSYKFSSTNLYYSILRNSIYKLKVDNVYDLGRDVPNGPTPDDKKPNYYLQCTVTVNQWVVSEQSVSLK